MRADKAPGDGLNADCPRIDDGAKPAQDAPLVLEDPPVREYGRAKAAEYIIEMPLTSYGDVRKR